MILFNGAWVMCKDASGYDCIYAVCGVSWNGDVLAGGEWRKRSSVRGVPIESCMMTESGWSREEIGDVVVYASPDRRLLMKEGACMNSDMKWVLHVDGPDMGTVANAEIEFVSQLQFIADIYGVAFPIVFKPDALGERNVWI